MPLVADPHDPSIGSFAIGITPTGGVILARTTPGVTKVIPSYLYYQYTDDDDLPSFIVAFNQMAQRYVDWLNYINLPVYTGAPIYGGLLDWVAQGLYGMARPTLTSGRQLLTGPYNTFGYNSGLAYGRVRPVRTTTYYFTTDDIFKRILTWHLWKADGKYFNIRWLKRRVMRFLTGTNGTGGNTDTSYQVSVTFGVGGQANIRILQKLRTITGGAIYGRLGYNRGVPYNGVTTKVQLFPQVPLARIFKAAVDDGVLELPFQYSWVVTIVG